MKNKFANNIFSFFYILQATLACDWGACYNFIYNKRESCCTALHNLFFCSVTYRFYDKSQRAVFVTRQVIEGVTYMTKETIYFSSISKGIMPDYMHSLRIKSLFIWMDVKIVFFGCYCLIPVSFWNDA